MNLRGFPFSGEAERPIGSKIRPTAAAAVEPRSIKGERFFVIRSAAAQTSANTGRYNALWGRGGRRASALAATVLCALGAAAAAAGPPALVRLAGALA